MPTLKLFVACEKIIVDQAGPASIISIFQRMNIQVTDVPLPEKAVAPNMWSLFSLWHLDVEELGREFTQIVKFYAPDKTLVTMSETIFLNALDGPDFLHMINVQMNTLPIWAEGFAEAFVWLKGDEEPSGSYKFQINHVRVPRMPSIKEG